MNKSDQAYKTIGEVTKILNLQNKSGQKTFSIPSTIVGLRASHQTCYSYLEGNCKTGCCQNIKRISKS